MEALKKVGAFLRTIVVALFGRMQWQAPGWARAVGGRAGAAGRWSREHKGPALGLGVGLLALAAGGGYGVHWWKHRPKPIETVVTVNAPELSCPSAGLRCNGPEDFKPRTASIDFDSAAAPLKMVNKPITEGITLSPALDGAWRWEGDRSITFTPKSDWPIGQEYTIKLAKQLVAPHIRLDKYKLEFSTPTFRVHLSDTEFYQDPVDANLKKVVATFTFTHPIEPSSFEKRVKMRLEPTNREEKAVDYRFHISYDKWKTSAFVHSEPISIPQKDAFMHVTLEKGTRAARGGPESDQEGAEKVKVPGLYNFLRVTATTLTLVDNERFEPEQVMVIETTGGVADQEMQKAVSAWVLPWYEPGNEDERKARRAHNWSDAAQIGPEILKAGEKLQLSAIAGEKEFSTLHSFKYKAEVGRWVYVQLKKGLHAFGGYVLGETYDTTQKVPEYPRQIKILHSGALVSMSGERKVSVYARDVPGIAFEIARVLPEQIHHFFGQSNGSFVQPSLQYNFNEENLAEFFHEERTLAAQPGKPQYEALDLSRYLAERRGLFLLKVDSWDPENKRRMGESDRRLILVTDLGILVKDAADGTHAVFVQSLHDGNPVGGATVQVLGKNGVAIATATTDSNGHAEIENLRDYQRERQPVLYVVKKAKDTSFLPFGRYDRYLNFSRFDVGGVTDTTASRGLNAYLFSDRGIYRPGDEIRVGLIVRAKDWHDRLEGVPLQITITDARGLLVKKENLKLSASGFEEIRHTTPEVAPTGTYSVNVYVVRDGQPSNLLGSTTVRVREFLPDRMKISVRLSEENPEGWVSPKDLKGRVTLANLYGTPATNRRVRAMLRLSPGLPTFGKYRGYTFFDPLKAREGGLSDNLADGSTDDQGEAEFDLQLSRFAPATYRLNFTAEGFEAEGGRSVTAESSVVVSPLPYLIGYKPDGELGYLSKGSKRDVEIIAVGPTGARLEVKSLKTILIERRYVSVLTRQDNGTYKYESVRKEIELHGKSFAISASGTHYALPTDKPGDFALLVRNTLGPCPQGRAGCNDEDLQRIEFTVAGYGNLTRSLEKNAELTLALKKGDFEPGTDIEMQIKAPFVGAGLITIEREKVFAYKWFKTDTTASVQTIKLPEDFEGDGYVSVAFVRDAASDEVFMSPLSYGVVPFSVSRAKRQAKITMTTPDLARPGEAYRMKVSVDRPTKMVVFAVDEGILRVADYKTPDPLAYFFQKRALGVRTAQILDLILPEYSRLLSAVAPGGDEEGAIGANLNPFRRKQNKPVAWWSGIIDAGPDEKELVYNVPDYFNGTLRVMAVAVAQDAVGTFEKRALVRGDFVLSPNVPTFTAPGDEFEVSVTVANNVVGSGKDADVGLELQVSNHLDIIGAARQKLKITELREASATFKVRAKPQLGSGTLTFVAVHGDKRGKLSTDLSVRPATPYLSSFTAGHLKDGNVSVPVTRSLYPEFRTLNAGISRLPLGLSHGLVGYLEKFPHGCTEQITSQVVPEVVLGNRPEFGFSRQTSTEAFSRFLAILRTRQNEEGAFGMWAANPRVSPLASVWAMHVLLDARERGLPVSGEMVKSGMSYLQTLATTDGDSLADERLRAYAIYVLTRNGMVTSNFAAALQKHAEANYPKAWRKDLTGAYLAATYKLLKQDRPARDLIDMATIGEARAPDYEHYDDRLGHDAELLYLIARHFPERAARVTAQEIDALAEPIFQGQYNTFTSAFTIMALEAYGKTASNPSGGSMAITELVNGQARALKLPESLLPIINFSERAQSVAFASAGPFEAFYLVNQRGFDLELPKKEIKSKVEIFREYTDANDKTLDEVKLGEEIRVHLRLRTLGQEALPYIAVVDLLPGGFEPVVQPQAGADSEARGYQRDTSRGEGEGEGGGGGGGGEGEDVRGAGDEDEGGGGGHANTSEGAGGGGFALPIALSQSTFSPEYGDVREDRVILYGTAEKDTKEFVYVIKATNVGVYTVPPPLADSMYDRTVVARGLGGKIRVVKAK